MYYLSRWDKILLESWKWDIRIILSKWFLNYNILAFKKEDIINEHKKKYKDIKLLRSVVIMQYCKV